jgi:hypothetical protein
MLRIFNIGLFVLILVLSLPDSAFPANKKLPAKVRIDTSRIQAKKFNAGALQHFRSDKDFDYSGDAVNQGESLWSRFWHWLWNVLFGWVGRAGFGKFLQYILLAISVLFLAYIIFKSLGIDAVKLIRGDARKVDIPYTETLENIHDINFDAEIENAVAQHNYRLAVRLLYLNCLKRLSDTNLIQWQIDKTNSAYVYELANPEQKQLFSLLTRRFEYVWYGNFSINKQTFGNVNQLFQTFIKQLP